jgi:hypothetical protein
MTDFENVRIIDLAVEKTKQSRSAPGLRHMYLKLSTTPPSIWCQIFKMGITCGKKHGLMGNISF